MCVRADDSRNIDCYDDKYFSTDYKGKQGKPKPKRQRVDNGVATFCLNYRQMIVETALAAVALIAI